MSCSDVGHGPPGCMVQRTPEGGEKMSSGIYWCVVMKTHSVTLHRPSQREISISQRRKNETNETRNA